MATVKAGTTTVTQIRTKAQRREAIYSRISDEQLRCMAGSRHRFATDELDPKSTKVPDGLNVVLKKGMYHIDEPCLRGCGRHRRFTTLSGGLFDVDTVYQYYTPRGTSDWVTIPAADREELDIRPRRAKAVLFDRNLANLKRVAVKAS